MELRVERGDQQDGACQQAQGQDPAVTVRANPKTVEWLLEHFELAEGTSLPRCTIFHHYIRHCKEICIEPMNQATFGKVIRSVFAGLRSRRLGTRGQSRYHYYGLRINPKSLLLQGIGIDEGTALRAKPGTNKQRQKSNNKTMVSSTTATNTAETEEHVFERQISHPAGSISSLQLIGHEFDHLGTSHAIIPDLLLNDLEWEKMDSLVTKSAIYPITSGDLRMFRETYRKHCEAVLEAVLALKFSAIEALWANFWRARYDEEAEKLLPFAKFYVVISCTALQDLIVEIDVEFFNSLTRVLIPNVLFPIPSSLTQVIRNFAKSMEGWVRESMVKMPRRLVHRKLLVANALAHALKRNTSLNHLAQAARTVLTNPAQTSTMLADLSRLDICSIHEQGSLMCPCDFLPMKKYCDEFKLLLSDFEVCERWPAWIDKLMEASLGSGNKQTIVTDSQDFCQKWSYFSSLAIRDLTLRSAASFGSFHLIRLLFDEYVVYALEQRTAKFSNVSSLQVFFKHLMNLYPSYESDPRGFPARSVMYSSSTLTSNLEVTKEPSEGSSTRQMAPETASSSRATAKRPSADVPTTTASVPSHKRFNVSS